jgi:hypothetical protein
MITYGNRSRTQRRMGRLGLGTTTSPDSAEQDPTESGLSAATDPDRDGPDGRTPASARADAGGPPRVGGVLLLRRSTRRVLPVRVGPSRLGWVVMAAANAGPWSELPPPEGSVRAATGGCGRRRRSGAPATPRRTIRSTAGWRCRARASGSGRRARASRGRGHCVPTHPSRREDGPLGVRLTPALVSRTTPNRTSAEQGPAESDERRDPSGIWGPTDRTNAGFCATTDPGTRPESDSVASCFADARLEGVLLARVGSSRAGPEPRSPMLDSRGSCSPGSARVGRGSEPR